MIGKQYFPEISDFYFHRPKQNGFLKLSARNKV